jgi:hypothetical protein
MILFRKHRIALGQGYLDRYTIFECKRLFSIYFHSFHTIAQDRFHSHAFHAVAIVLMGGYWEELIIGDGEPFFERISLVRRISRGIRFIPRSCNHRILLSSPRTYSIVLAGPWAKTWTETKNGSTRTLGWGRKILSE